MRIFEIAETDAIPLEMKSCVGFTEVQHSEKKYPHNNSTAN